MSQAIVQTIKGPVDDSFTLLEKFIEVCPDDLWGEKQGGWPIWQQIYHAAGAVDFFIDTPGLPPLEQLASAAVGGLAEIATETVSKDKVKAVLNAARAKVDKFVAGLSDADLTTRNESVFTKANLDWSLGATLATIGSHNLYHLGSCDAALRNKGLSGVY